MNPDRPKTFANQLFMLVKTALIHDPRNKAFAQPLEQFRNLIGEFIQVDGQVSLESVDLSLFFNEMKIRSDISTFATFQYLHDEFASRNIGGIRFMRTPTTEELASFIAVFVRRQDPSALGVESLNALLADNNVESAEFLEQKERVSSEAVTQSHTVAQKRRALRNYVKAIDVMRTAALNMNSPKMLEARKAKRIVYNLVDICIEEGFSFLGLANVKNYDEYTFNHSVNVCVISIGFGKNLGLTKKQIGQLGVAGLYHDYGKLAIPKDILNKPGKFEAHEWEVMKSHPMESIKNLLRMKSIHENDIKKMIAAFEHHRNYDCTGYPDTGVKKKMNFYSRVVAIADAYDAMTTNRVYQRALVPTMALKILMDNAGTKFDPLLVKAFVNTVGIYPVGSLLKMNDGTLSLVTAVPQDPTKLEFPTVRLVADARGKQLVNGPEIDLAKSTEEGKPWAIETVLHPEDYHINVAHHLFGDLAKDAGLNVGKPSPSVH